LRNDLSVAPGTRGAQSRNHDTLPPQSRSSLYAPDVTTRLPAVRQVRSAPLTWRALVSVVSDYPPRGSIDLAVFATSTILRVA